MWTQPVLQCQALTAKLCLNLKDINKILPLAYLEPAPDQDAAFVGLLNLEGKTVPVYDLAMCIGLKREQDYTLHHVMIVMQNDEKNLGMIVDSVQGIINPESIILDEHNNQFGKYGQVLSYNSELIVNIDIKKLFKEKISHE